MKGAHSKTRKRKLGKMPTKAVTSDAVSFQAAEDSDAVTPVDTGAVQCTPKRGRRPTEKPCLTSTPVHSSCAVKNISKSPPEGKQMELKCTAQFAQASSVVSTSTSKSVSPSRRGRRVHSSQPRQLRKRPTKETKQTCSTNGGAPAINRRGRVRKNQTAATTSRRDVRSRPRFELEKAEAAEEDESLLSSDLSIELSQEERLPSLSFEAREESDDAEEELPSFLQVEKKPPPPITEGAFVWHKYRNYPFWPAMVKSVNRKQKKASILFIDDPMRHKTKGFTVALKTLKPFDCEESEELMCKAKEKYDAAIKWSLELITDYRIRIACGSFSDSFIKYFAHDMSYPVRRKYPKEASERITITSDTTIEVLSDEDKEDSLVEQEEDVGRRSTRLLPDRSHAAHNRANEKLVNFIVKQRMVEEHLLAVMCGQQQSRWLRSFLRASRRRVVDVYLEDDRQLDQVFWYLDGLYLTAVDTASCLTEVKSRERVAFVLDVLLPEAIIYAMAGVGNISVKKAEEKYLKGRGVSNRERQEFDVMIERHMRNSQYQNTALSL